MRQRELTNNKNIKDKCQVRFMLKDVFGFPEHQKEAIYGSGYKLTLTKNKDDAVLNKAEAIADARIEIHNIHWYVPHYTPCNLQQCILRKQIFCKTPTELRHNERSVSMKEVNNQNLWNFELGKEESMNVPICIIIGYQQRDRQAIDLNNDTFCRLPVTSTRCIIGSEKFPDAGMLLSYHHDDYSQVYGQIK